MQILIFTIIFTFLDQLTKYLAVAYLEQPKVFIEQFLSLELAHNLGVAFSIPVPLTVVIVFTVIFLVFGAWWVKKELDVKQKSVQICVALVASGALGNLIDRVRDGYVTDFVSIWRWPIFNLADVWIFIGILGIFLFYGKIHKK